MKLKRILLITGITLLSAVVILLIFLSSIVKYLIEKHSEAYTGRKIKMENLHINIFSGNIRFDQLKVYEAKSETLFFSCNKLLINLSVPRLISSKYDISKLLIEKPLINITQRGKRFNYDDLVKRFTTGNATPAEKSKKPTQYWIHNLQVDSAKVVYVNTKPYNKVEIIDWDIKVPLIAWNDPVYNINTSLALATGGKLGSDIVINSNSFLYKVKFNLQQFNIAVLYPYLKDYLKVKTLDGLLSATMSLSGNMHKPEDIAASGNVDAAQFSIIDNTDEKLTSIAKMNIQIDSINTKNNFYNFKTINIIQPYLKFAMYDDGYNFQRIMTSPGGSSTDTATAVYANLFIMMADYVQSIMKNYIASNYSAEQLKIERGHMIFTDYTHGDKFQYDLDSLYMFSDRVSSNKSRIVIDMNSLLNRSGVMKGKMSVNPKDFEDMDIDCVVSDLLISDFNPYSKYYVATPFLNGAVTYTNKTTIIKRKLTSKNVLQVVKIEAGKKVKNKTAMNLPVRLAVSLLKDVHGNIHLDVPVAGSLDDPKFKWGKIVWQVIKNIIVKAATAPFRFFANVFGGKEEDYKEVNFDYLQKAISPSQQKTLDNLAHVLTEKPDIKLQLVQVTSRQDEAETYALQEAKKGYLGFSADSITSDRQSRIDSVADRDSLFNAYLNKSLPAGSAFMSPQEKCIQIIGREKTDAVVSNAIEKRNQAVLNYLVQEKHITADRVLVSTAKDETQLSRGERPKYLINIAVKE